MVLFLLHRTDLLIFLCEMALRMFYSVIFIAFPNQQSFAYHLNLCFAKFFTFVESKKVILSLWQNKYSPLVKSRWWCPCLLDSPSSDSFPRVCWLTGQPVCTLLSSRWTHKSLRGVQKTSALVQLTAKSHVRPLENQRSVLISEKSK